MATVIKSANDRIDVNGEGNENISCDDNANVVESIEIQAIVDVAHVGASLVNHNVPIVDNHKGKKSNQGREDIVEIHQGEERTAVIVGGQNAVILDNTAKQELSDNRKLVEDKEHDTSESLDRFKHEAHCSNDKTCGADLMQEWGQLEQSHKNDELEWFNDVVEVLDGNTLGNDEDDTNNIKELAESLN